MIRMHDDFIFSSREAYCFFYGDCCDLIAVTGKGNCFLCTGKMSSWLSKAISLAQVAVEVSQTAYMLGSSSFLLERGGRFEAVDPVAKELLVRDFLFASSISSDIYDLERMEANLGPGVETSLLWASPTVVSYFDPADKTLWVVCRGTQSAADVLMDFGWLATTAALPDTDVIVPGAVADVVGEVMGALPAGAGSGLPSFFFNDPKYPFP